MSHSFVRHRWFIYKTSNHPIYFDMGFTVLPLACLFLPENTDEIFAGELLRIRLKFTRKTWRIYTSDMIGSRVRHDSFLFLTHSYVKHDSCIPKTCLIHVQDITHFHLRRHGNHYIFCFFFSVTCEQGCRGGGGVHDLVLNSSGTCGGLLVSDADCRQASWGEDVHPKKCASKYVEESKELFLLPPSIVGSKCSQANFTGFTYPDTYILTDKQFSSCATAIEDQVMPP